MYNISNRLKDHEDGHAHSKIDKRRENGQLKYAVYEKWFDSLTDLMDYYRKHRLGTTRRGVAVKLAVPVLKKKSKCNS